MHKCNIKDCVYETKCKTHLKQHKSNIHNIDVK